MKNAALVLGVGVIGFGLYQYIANANAGLSSASDTAGIANDTAAQPGGWDAALNDTVVTMANATNSAADFIGGLLGGSMGFKETIAQPENAAYIAAMKAAENAYHLPVGLLARVAYQESRFRPDIINGGANSAGAIGLMQIVPKWNPGVNPSDPFASITYAAKKLAGLFGMFGTWELALKAYNWGEGNVKKWLQGMIKQPLETLNYSAQILADLGGSVYA